MKINRLWKGFLLSIALFIVVINLRGQSIVAVQNEAGFVMCTKTGEIYFVNASTGTTKLITTAPSPIAINSLATDTVRGIVYYCYNNYISTNKSIYGYNYRTNSHFTLINDFSTAPGSPQVGLGGVGTAGASFYNGYLYFGVELARSLSPGVPNIGAHVPYTNRIYQVTLDAAGTSITATSLVKDYYNDNGYIYYSNTPFGSPVAAFFRYDNNWGDFVIINDTLFDRAVKGYSSGSFWFEQTTVAYDINNPAAQLYNTLTIPATTVLNDGFSYVQTASDGMNNLILVGNEGNTNQLFVIADKTTGNYNIANAKPLLLNGAPFAQAVTDCGNVIRGEGTIGNMVWHDANENGIKDLSEPGIPYVPVELWEDVNSNGIVDEASDKLLGTAITASDGSYGFINMLQGDYLVRCVLTASVNYPALGFSASYPTNPLISARLVDAGDETVAGANITNLISRSFTNLVFGDQTHDFGFADVFLLPHDQLNLAASCTKNTVKLNWELTLTGNEASYEIERSSDGKLFNTIYRGVIALNNLRLVGTNWDDNLPPGSLHLFYRIKLTDKNGKIKRSIAVKVKTGSNPLEQVSVYPNPAKNKTTFLIPKSLINQPVSITLTNVSGQLFRKFEIAKATDIEVINITGIMPGTYFWKLNSVNQQKATFSGKLKIE